MTADILTRLRNWNPETADTRTDFDDDEHYVYRSRVARDMIRDVKGATDLRDAMPQRVGLPSAFAGQVVTDPDSQRRDTRPFADEVGQPSPKQRELIIKLINELMDLDPYKGQQAAEYTLKMTAHAAWEKEQQGQRRVGEGQHFAVDRHTDPYCGTGSRTVPYPCSRS